LARFCSGRPSRRCYFPRLPFSVFVITSEARDLIFFRYLPLRSHLAANPSSGYPLPSRPESRTFAARSGGIPATTSLQLNLPFMLGMPSSPPRIFSFFLFFLCGESSSPSHQKLIIPSRRQPNLPQSLRMHANHIRIPQGYIRQIFRHNLLHLAA
jgi:hypothetical protein